MRPDTDSVARDERRLGMVAAGFLAAMTAAVVLGKPGHASFLPPCPLHALTGWFCPGCGATRSLYLLVHGELARAFGENALAVLMLPFVVYELIAGLTRRLPVVSCRLRPWTLWTLLVVVILFAVLRNLPFAPFTLLAPTELR